jgi:hypothetical protein
MNKKDYYESPTTFVVDVCFEGVVCTSGLGGRSIYDEDDSNPFA